MKNLYHYTILQYAKEIIKSGKVERATAGVPKDEKPICWLSTNVFHEVSAFPFFSLQRLIEFGYVRFTVKNDRKLKICKWNSIAKKANMSPHMKIALETCMSGKSKEWYGTLQEVPLDFIQNIEYMDKSKNWVSVSREELLNLETEEKILIENSA